MKLKKYVKIGILIIIVGLCTIASIGFVNAQKTENDSTEGIKNSSERRNGDPMKFVNQIYRTSNKGLYDVQDTSMDDVSSSGIYPNDYTMSNTFYNVMNKLHNYFQYVVYIGLASATILIILNGLKFVIKGESHLKEFQKNIIYIVVGICLLTGFYFLIELLTRVGNTLLE